MRTTRRVNDEELKEAKEIGQPFVREYEEGDFCELEGICDRKRLNKLGQLEDIEEELGIELKIFFDALRNGVYYYTHSHQLTKDNVYLVSEYLTANNDKLAFDFVTRFESRLLLFNEFGKTWSTNKNDLTEGD